MHEGPIPDDGGAPPDGSAWDLAARVRQLEDLHRIRCVLQTYARALDRGDWDLMRTCFTADATDDHGPFQGGVDALVRGTRELMAEYWGTMHVLGQSHIELDGDTAAVETTPCPSIADTAAMVAATRTPSPASVISTDSPGPPGDGWSPGASRYRNGTPRCPHGSG